MTQDPFAQVRQAHRICGAYYQQILPMINEVALKSGAVFLLWKVWGFNKPSNKNANPLVTWKWDYMPMLDVSFVFCKQEHPDTPMTPTDYVLDFKLVTDSELEYHQRVLQYGKEKEPIATQLKKSATESQSYLNVYLFSTAKDNLIDTPPESLWEGEYPYPDTDSEIHLLDNNRIKGIGFSIQLTDIAHDNSVHWLVDKITEHRIKLVGS